MTGQVIAISRRDTPEILPQTDALIKQRARGMPGAQCTRSLVRAGGVLVCARVFTAEAPESSGIPHAMVLRFIRDLPGDEFLLPPSPRGLDGISYPGWAECASARLDINNGCQDHTTFAVRVNAARLARLSRSLTSLTSPCDLMRTRHRRVHRIPPHVS